jgi:hypothetical protein
MDNNQGDLCLIVEKISSDNYMQYNINKFININFSEENITYDLKQSIVNEKTYLATYDAQQRVIIDVYLQPLNTDPSYIKIYFKNEIHPIYIDFSVIKMKKHGNYINTFFDELIGQYINDSVNCRFYLESNVSFNMIVKYSLIKELSRGINNNYNIQLFNRYKFFHFEQYTVNNKIEFHTHLLPFKCYGIWILSDKPLLDIKYYIQPPNEQIKKDRYNNSDISLFSDLTIYDFPFNIEFNTKYKYYLPFTTLKKSSGGCHYDKADQFQPTLLLRSNHSCHNVQLIYIMENYILHTNDIVEHL